MTNMQSLYEISSELLEFQRLMTDLEGEILPEEIEKQIDEFLADSNTKIEKKLDNYAALIKTVEARMEFREAESKRIAALAAIDKNMINRLKDRLKNFFELHNLQPVQTDRFRVALQKNGGVRPLNISVEFIEKPELLPERFQKIKVEVDTKEIREAINAGETIDFAYLGEAGYSIRIK